jgi:hypothetical protein
VAVCPSRDPITGSFAVFAAQDDTRCPPVRTGRQRMPGRNQLTAGSAALPGHTRLSVRLPGAGALIEWWLQRRHPATSAYKSLFPPLAPVSLNAPENRDHIARLPDLDCLRRRAKHHVAAADENAPSARRQALNGKVIVLDGSA